MDRQVFLKPVREEDMPVIHQWWDDPDNFGATGIESDISFEAALSLFRARPSAQPFEEWFAICVTGIKTPVGIIAVAPNHPRWNLVSIGSVIIDKKCRRRGFGRQAIERLEKWTKTRYPGSTISLGVLECSSQVTAFWEACGYGFTEMVETEYTYQSHKQRAFKFEKMLD